MQDCWNDEPSKRPQFSRMASFFKEMLAGSSKVSRHNFTPQYHVFKNEKKN
jgi:hypothetical protein